ncbi:MAG: hypothetical protein V1738_00255 [Patescibacteria group bacterium]
MAENNNSNQTTKAGAAKPSLIKSPILPIVIIVVALGLAVLQQNGYIDLRRINSGSTGVYTLASTPVNVPYSHDFSAELIPLLGPDNDSPTYTFYLGSGVGFPPTGLILGIDGILKGTPAVVGYSKFQVCVKDVGGHSSCQIYSLTVTEKPESSPTSPRPTSPSPSPTSPPATHCPTKLNPPCGSSENGGPAAYGGIVPGDCNCPAGSAFDSMDNITPGGPYKICVCQ